MNNRKMLKGYDINDYLRKDPELQKEVISELLKENANLWTAKEQLEGLWANSTELRLNLEKALQHVQKTLMQYAWNADDKTVVDQLLKVIGHALGKNTNHMEITND